MSVALTNDDAHTNIFAVTLCIQSQEGLKLAL